MMYMVFRLRWITLARWNMFLHQTGTGGMALSSKRNCATEVYIGLEAKLWEAARRSTPWYGCGQSVQILIIGVSLCTTLPGATKVCFRISGMLKHIPSQGKIQMFMVARVPYLWRV